MYAGRDDSRGELLLGRAPVHHAALCGRAPGRPGRIDVLQAWRVMQCMPTSRLAGRGKPYWWLPNAMPRIRRV